MIQSTNRPRVFVSSTIKDFRDLRSALKFWLESMGCTVLMSEFNDFDRRPDQGTFESCFSAIESCHYYILLVGARKGSEYRDGISVTQQEYRIAASLAQEGRIKPVIFVRAEVETAVAERKAIRGSRMERVSAEQSGSKVLEDQDAIELFIEEIHRTELKRREPSQPKEFVWCYSFDDFGDLVQALQVNLHLYRSVRQQVLLANLQREIEDNLIAMSSKGSSGLTYFQWELRPVRQQIQISADVAMNGTIQLTAEQANRVAGFLLTGLPAAERFKTLALQDAISSGEFLVYEHGTGRVELGGTLRAMQSLLLNLKRYQGLLRDYGNRQSQQLALLSAAREMGRQIIDIPGFDLTMLFCLHDTMENILVLSTKLLRYMKNPVAEMSLPNLMPASPVEGQQVKLEKETATQEDIEQWLSYGYKDI